MFCFDGLSDDCSFGIVYFVGMLGLFFEGGGFLCVIFLLLGGYWMGVFCFCWFWLVGSGFVCFGDW